MKDHDTFLTGHLIKVRAEAYFLLEIQRKALRITSRPVDYIKTASGSEDYL